MERSPRLHRPLTPLPRLFLQLLNERLMGAEGTKMDDDFLKMEKVKPLITVLIQETVLPPKKNTPYKGRLFEQQLRPIFTSLVVKY